MALVVGFSAIIAGDWGVWIGLALFGSWTAWAWYKEKGNVVDSFRDFMLVFFLLATSLGGAVSGCAQGVRNLPGTSVAEVQAWWTKNVHTVTVDTAPATTTTTAPPAPPAPGAP
jgi:hypothetical protein